MGVVCEAEHLEIGKRLAIKLIDASLAGMSDIAMRFRQEARAASLVESQHIVQVFDVGADEKLGLYLVMEYLTGEDLSARARAREAAAAGRRPCASPCRSRAGWPRRTRRASCTAISSRRTSSSPSARTTSRS